MFLIWDPFYKSNKHSFNIDIKASQESWYVEKIYFALLIEWDGEDVKATELMNIPTQSLFNIVTYTCNCHFSATLSSEKIPEKKNYAVPLKTRQNPGY